MYSQQMGQILTDTLCWMYMIYMEDTMHGVHEHVVGMATYVVWIWEIINIGQ